MKSQDAMDPGLHHAKRHILFQVTVVHYIVRFWKRVPKNDSCDPVPGSMGIAYWR